MVKPSLCGPLVPGSGDMTEKGLAVQVAVRFGKHLVMGAFYCLVTFIVLPGLRRLKGEGCPLEPFV